MTDVDLIARLRTEAETCRSNARRRRDEAEGHELPSRRDLSLSLASRHELDALAFDAAADRIAEMAS